MGGIIALMKDALRLTFFLLKRPHYVAVLLAVIIGLFYLNGIPPHKISTVLESKWQALVENRKQTFKEDIQIIAKHFGKTKAPAAINATVEKASDPADIEDQFNPADELVIRREEITHRQKEQFEKNKQYMQEEVFGWQQAFQEVPKQDDLSDENAIEGVLSVVSADKVRIEEKTFSLKIRLRAGKAGEAYQKLKRHFNGRKAKCIPDEKNPEKAECFAGALSASEMLVDFGLADPV